MEFVIVDGEIVKKEEANLTSFFWNEPQLVHDKIWYGFGSIPLFSESLKIILEYLNLIGARIPELLQNERELFRITKRMLNKNKFFRSGHIIIHLSIHNQNVHTLITSTPFKEIDFPFSEQGLLLHFSELKKFSGNPLSKFHFFHQFNEDVEKAVISCSSYQNAIFFNENNVVCDTIGANIFMLKNKTLITPSLETGCAEDILRSIILEIAVFLGLKVLESGSIKKEDLFQMNELFLVSMQNGIQWIMGIENKRFVRQKSIQIHQKLNEYLKQKVN